MHRSVNSLTDSRGFDSQIMLGRLYSHPTLRGVTVSMSIIPFLSNSSFDPEMTDILASAFDTAWQRVQSSGSPLGLDEAAPVTRETLARKIIAAAQSGERNKNRLVESALASLAPQLEARQASSS